MFVISSIKSIAGRATLLGIQRVRISEDQTKLFALLKPKENVGVRLTTGFLLDPEQGTSAIVVHHPAAKYFVV